MIGSFILFTLVLIEVGFLIFSLARKLDFKREKSFTSVALFLVFLILVLSPIIDWNFKWLMIGLFLGLQAIFGITFIVHNKENSPIKTQKIIFKSLGKLFLIVFLVIPSIILPQFKEIKQTGGYSVGTVSYTLIDESRQELFTKEDDNRKVTIQLWYPIDDSVSEESVAGGKFPLVVFSHGAFGFRMSNFSTFQELASNGYVVCSIDHTFHSFMTKQVDDKSIIGNLDFINSAMEAQNGTLDGKVVYDLGVDWMKLRTGDMEFVLDYIKDKALDNKSNDVFESIDLEYIGVFGHSLGGATAAQIGRDDVDVDSVIVIDGTMLGEIIGFENGKEIFSEVPYPKPIMNIYNESHYAEALANQDDYANMVASNMALDSYEVVIQGAGHINFTDLPIVSPQLSKLLGTGKVNPRYCIETTNQVILQFFDSTLKSGKDAIAKERVY